MTLPLPTEEMEQRSVVLYLEAMHCKFTSIPNSTFTKSHNQRMKNQRAGLRAGFPDLAIIANGTFFCIEMKRQKGGTVSPQQKEWHEALNAAGVPTYVCKGFEEARRVIDRFLVGSRPG